MTTPLDELRRAIVAQEAVNVDETSILIGDSQRLDRTLPTNFHSMRGRGDAYLLEAVYFQFKFRNLPYNDYVQACRRERVAHVTLLDKKNLIAFLTGEITTCASIVTKASDPASKPEPVIVPPVAARAEETGNEAGARVAEAEQDEKSYAALRGRDRDQRALDSVLMLSDWDFSALRDKLSQHIASARSGKGANAESGSKATGGYDPRGDRYTSNEGRFWRENLGTDFQELGIDMSGSFKAKPTAAPSSSEKPRDKRESRLSREPPAKRARVDPKELVPIIIVPAGSTLICSGNAVEFIQNGRFIPIEELKKSKGPSEQILSNRSRAIRTPGGNCSRAEYAIVSNPNRLAQKEWDRVVGVVLSGQEWQFKSWPINDKGTQELFRKVQGFYFHYDDVATTGNVENWAIKKVSLSRDKRHTDGQAQVHFWNTLDTFMRRKNKHLRY